MALVSKCKICRCTIISSELCDDCTTAIALVALTGQAIDKVKIREQVRLNREKKYQRETKAMLDNLTEEEGRQDWKKYRDEALSLKEELEQLRSRPIEDNWISVKDDLPKPGQQVFLIDSDTGYAYVGCMNKPFEWWFYTVNKEVKHPEKTITHWKSTMKPEGE